MHILVELKSETIFGSGYSVPGFVDLEVVHEDNGLPYFKGKTFKGKLREECQNIIELIPHENIKEEYNKSLINIFGKEDNDEINSVNFSDLKINNNIRSYIEYGIQKNFFSKEEVLSSLTDIRQFTKLNESGVAEDGSLRQFRVINKGVSFQCDLTFERPLDEKEIQLLSCGVKALKHIGGLENRGKGLIEAFLIDKGRDICEENINEFVERVKSK